MSAFFRFFDHDMMVHHSRDDKIKATQNSMHAHEFFELFYFIEGRGKYYVEGRQYPVYPGCLMVMRSGETHHPDISTEHAYERMAVHFAPAALQELDPKGRLVKPFTDRPLGIRNLYEPGLLNGDLVRLCMSGMSSNVRNASDDYERRIAILSYLLPVLREVCRCFAIPEESTEAAANGVIGGVAEYINAHLSEPFTLDSLAAQFYISKSYLNTRFKKVTGSTIWEYTLIKRLLLARRLIREGIPAADACTQSGWNDYTAFYRQYKARLGVSPSDDKAPPVQKA